MTLMERGAGLALWSIAGARMDGIYRGEGLVFFLCWTCDGAVSLGAGSARVWTRTLWNTGRGYVDGTGAGLIICLKAAS